MELKTLGYTVFTPTPRLNTCPDRAISIVSQRIVETFDSFQPSFSVYFLFIDYVSARNSHFPFLPMKKGIEKRKKKWIVFFLRSLCKIEQVYKFKSFKVKKFLVILFLWIKMTWCKRWDQKKKRRRKTTKTQNIIMMHMRLQILYFFFFFFLR